MRLRTVGGVVGKVYSVKGDNVVLETGPDKVKVTFTRGAIATVGDAEDGSRKVHGLRRERRKTQQKIR